MHNSLKYAKILENAGFDRTIAEAHIQILTEITGEDMATKDDLYQVKSDLQVDISNLKSELQHEISDLRSELKNDMSNLRLEMQGLEYRMTLKLGGLMAAFLATGLTAAKILLI